MFAYKLKRQIQTLFIINENAIVFEVLHTLVDLTNADSDKSR